MSKEKNTENYIREEFIIEKSVYYTEVPDSFKNREVYTSPNPKILKALIPGTIMEVHIEPDQQVEAGENLMILEAMKMRNLVESTLSGEIKNILVKTGDIVRKGAVLVEFK